MSLRERAAVWGICDTFVLSSVREGLNTNPFELLITRDALELPPPALVVSEFASCTSVLAGAIRVNPWDLGLLEGALEAALRMSDADRAARHQANQRITAQKGTRAWLRRIIADVRAGALACLSTDYIG